MTLADDDLRMSALDAQGAFVHVPQDDDMLRDTPKEWAEADSFGGKTTLKIGADIVWGNAGGEGLGAVDRRGLGRALRHGEVRRNPSSLQEARHAVGIGGPHR